MDRDGDDNKKRYRERKRWTEEEDAILYEEAMKQSSTGNVRDWHRIATKLPGRTNKDCRKRWVNRVCGGLKKGLWDPEEDRRLQAAVEKHGLRWPLIAAEVGFRSPDQCAKRWQYGLDPRLKHREWTAEEDKLLLTLVQQRGREWKAIQHNHYPTRSRIDLKNRYTILMRRMGNIGGDQDPDAYPDDAGSDTSSGGSDDGTGTGTSTTGRSIMTNRSSHSHSHASQSPHCAPGHHSRLHSASASSEPVRHDSQQLSHIQPDWLNDTTTFGVNAGLHTPSNSPSVQIELSDVTDPSLTMGYLDTTGGVGVTSALGQELLPSAWDDPFTTSAFAPTSTSMPTHAAYLPTFTTESGAMDPGKDMDTSMDMAFDPELLDPDTANTHGLSMDPSTEAASSATPASGSGSGSGSVGQGQMDLDEMQTQADVGKVLIAVEGCDRDTLDYLFNVTRPIKRRVKMEITMR